MSLILKRTIQPILLVLYMSLATYTYGKVPEIIILLSIILFNATFLMVMEHYIPFEKTWKMTKAEFKQSSAYFLIGAVADSLGKVLAIILISKLSIGNTEWPLYITVPLAVMTLEFFGYWIHRYSHTGGFLWKVHSIHHTPEKVNTWNNNKMHPVNIILLKFARLGSLILFGFNEETIFLAGSFGLIQNYISHANIDIRGRWYSYIIGTPEMHRLHHSKDKSEAGNFSAVIPIWDLLFGSFILGKKIKEAGVHNRESYPSGISKELQFPFIST